MKNDRRLRLMPSAPRLHKAERIIDETREKGYALYECGAYFMHFHKSNERYAYRAELSRYHISSLNGRECEYDPIYESKGWQRIPGSGNICIYRAEEGAELPEIAKESRMRASKKHLLSAVFSLCFVVLALIAIMSPVLFGIRGGLANTIFINIIKGSSELLYFLYFPILGVLFLFDLISYALLYRANKQGERFSRSVFGGAAPAFMCFFAALLCVCLFVMSFKPSAHDLPKSAEGQPYLLCAEIGVSSKDDSQPNRDHGSMTETGSLFGRTYSTSEYLNAAKIGSAAEGSFWLMQDIYELKSARLAGKLVAVLKERSEWHVGDEPAEKVKAEGFDEVWHRGNGVFIALKGTRVAELKCFGNWDSEQALNEVEKLALNKLLEKWNALN